MTTTKDPRSRIQDLCSEALAATSAGQIEPLLSHLRAALHEKIQGESSWVALCERAAVEQDPRRLLELVSEINRLFQAREKGLESPNEPARSDEQSTF